VVTAPLAKIVSTGAASKKLARPVLIVVGDVVKLRRVLQAPATPLDRQTYPRFLPHNHHA
jgi:uroporphyrinogen III methyltransferase/synthase